MTERIERLEARTIAMEALLVQVCSLLLDKVDEADTAFQCLEMSLDKIDRVLEFDAHTSRVTRLLDRARVATPSDSTWEQYLEFLKSRR